VKLASPYSDLHVPRPSTAHLKDIRGLRFFLAPFLSGYFSISLISDRVFTHVDLLLSPGQRRLVGLAALLPLVEVGPVPE